MITIEQFLERNGMTNIVEEYGIYTCEYKGHKISIYGTSEATTWNCYFALRIDGKQICTRCKIRNIIPRIKKFAI